MGSLIAEGLIVRLNSTTFSRMTYKLFKGNPFFFLSFLKIFQVVCVLGANVIRDTSLTISDKSDHIQQLSGAEHGRRPRQGRW